MRRIELGTDCPDGRIGEVIHYKDAPADTHGFSMLPARLTKNALEAYIAALEYALKCADYEHGVHSVSNEWVKPVPAYLAAIDRMKVHLEAELSRVKSEKTPSQWRRK
jgi:hypothetical protein